MLVTLSGMVIEVRPLHPEKAYSPIVETLSPIIYFSTWLPNIVLRLFEDEYVAEIMAFEFNSTDVRPLHP